MTTGRKNVNCLVGLGNPGGKYSSTYHNLGFRAVDTYLKKFETVSTQNDDSGKLFELSGDAPVQFAGKPGKFVNRSGEVVKEWTAKLELDPQQLLVIYDDFELDLGRIRLRKQGSAGGHNGLKDIIEKLNTRKIPRLRVGIGPLPTNSSPRDFVLAKITRDDRRVFSEIYKKLPKIVGNLAERGFETAMDRWNGVDFSE